MQMQLNALFGIGVAALRRFDLLHGVRLQHHFVVIAVKAHLALHAQPHAGLHIVDDGLGLCSLHKLVDADGAGIVCHIKAHDPRAALFELSVLHGEDLALDDDAEHVEIQLVHPHGLSGERPPVEQCARRLRRCRSASTGRLCAALRRAGRDGGRVFERLGTDARRLLKQRPALQIAVRLDLDLFGYAETVAQELLGLLRVLQNAVFSVGLEPDDDGLVRDRIAGARQNGGRRRKGADKHLRQIAEIHIRKLFGGITHRKLQLLQTVLFFHGPAERLELLFCKIVLRLRVQTDGARFPVQLGVDDGKTLKRLRQLLRQRKVRKQRGEIYFIHGMSKMFSPL